MKTMIAGTDPTTHATEDGTGWDTYFTCRKPDCSKSTSELCQKPTPESIFGDVPDTNITKAILDAIDRRKCKTLRPLSRC